MSSRQISEVGRRQAAASVKAAAAAFIENHPEIDNWGRKVLMRLFQTAPSSVSLSAAEAICAIPAEKWPVLFCDCIIGERSARLHAGERNDALATKKRAGEAMASLGDVASFLGIPRGGIISSKADPLDIKAVDSLRQSIELRRTAAKIFLRRSSRKKDEPTARSVGLGWIQESLVVLGGRPAVPSIVAAIATAALGLEYNTLTTDMVRKAEGPRQRYRTSDAAGAYPAPLPPLVSS